MMQVGRYSEDQSIAGSSVSDARQNPLRAAFLQHEQSTAKNIAAKIQTHPYLIGISHVTVPVIVMARSRDHAIDPSTEPLEAFAVGNLFYHRAKFGTVHHEVEKTGRGQIIGDVFLTDLTV